MAKTFFENFKEADRIMPRELKNPYGEANLPSVKESRNSAAWRERVAIPFSYIISDGGERQYGTLYVPAYEANKIRTNGTVRSDDIEIYGADLTDGLSLNEQGFRNLYDKFSNNDFRIENGAANAASQAANGGDLKQVSPAVPVENVPFFKNLRETLKNLQRGGGA